MFEYSIVAGLVGALILAVFFNPGVSNREPGFNQAEEDAPAGAVGERGRVSGPMGVTIGPLTRPRSPL